MVELNLQRELSLDEPVLVEGLPGVGLVGKIATDHLVDELELSRVGALTGEEIPKVALFDAGYELHPPVRLFVDEERDLLALRSDVPLPGPTTGALASALTDWLAGQDVLPIYLAGFPRDRQLGSVPDIYGVGTGDAIDRLAAADIDPPDEGGMISGPAGALLDEARERDLDAAGLVVETDPRFPDPQGAHALVEKGIEPLADVEVDTERLVERADEIVEQREQLAQQMRQADTEESSQASGISMYQ